MINPPLRRRPEPVSALSRFARPVLAAAALTVTLVAVGCGGGEEQQQAAAPPPPPPPAPAPVRPSVVSVADLMAQLGIDDRVYLEEGNAPGTTEERTAVLEFFDAFVRGRDTTLRPMLAEADRPYLADLVDTMGFAPLAESIEEVELVGGVSPDGRPAVLGMYVRDGRDEYQLWYYGLDAGLATFEAAPSPPGIVQRLSGPVEGYIDRWHEILDEDMALASQPDEPIVLDVNLDEESDDEGPGASSAPATQPGPGGGGPRRHRPTRPRRPPGVR